MLDTIKAFFKSLLSAVEAVNRGRAAAILARQGNHEAARRLMLES